ncbi:MAG: FeoA family protein [Bacillota bacterium]|uniref:Ferrous iron transport protein A n=1 Tax=[Clostridium] aminophilum TaxID=1526 RepID=A0A1I6I8Q7_9FIRM|nr:FeoA family protein [[Clostridium] aminophilum]MCR4629685.1 ferrous iron transport protein A [Clostridium sp.]MDT3843141.1 FeoA family protein [Bacillota bacterium]MDD6195504.1 FeoA family protein [[Clostridium] aminophilum]SET22511.1 ferrous iron transport protein A [[Clostridium] aminophilum]SFR63028.1 ferrous iron transport protein A [[Clostridium] aminophilum]
MMPLSFAKPGEQVMVTRVSGNAEIKKHLEDLGFVAGTPVQIIASPGSGNIIVGLKESRLAITDQMAAKIMVQ